MYINTILATYNIGFYTVRFNIQKDTMLYSLTAQILANRTFEYIISYATKFSVHCTYYYIIFLCIKCIRSYLHFYK